MDTYRLLQLARIHGSKKLNIPKDIQQWEKSLSSQGHFINEGPNGSQEQSELLDFAHGINDGSFDKSIQDGLFDHSIEDGLFDNSIEDERIVSQKDHQVSVESYPSIQIESELEQLFSPIQSEPIQKVCHSLSKCWLIIVL
jgi:hypothetical protein